MTHGPIQPVSWAYTDAVTKYAFDPARARALLDEAGWRDSDGDGIRERGGQRLAFTLITQAGFAVRESVAQVLQRQFRDVGVDMTISAARRHEHQPASGSRETSTPCCTGGRCPPTPS